MRYRVSDLPKVGLGAFTPIPTTTPAASSQGLVGVLGCPGTQPVDSPRPEAVPSLTVQGGKNSAQSSAVSPDVIFPSIYVASVANMGPSSWVGMWRRRFTELPMPARNPGRIPVVAFQAPRVGGRNSMAWPRAFQRFPARPTSGTPS